MAEGEIVIPTNEFQTPITREFLDSMPEWVKEQFLEFVYKVPLIKYMIGLDRPRAKDLPRDKNGRIIVDIAHPHILENMDYFRPAVKFFEENGCYTFLKPNRNPKSEFGKWITEEARRCREGYVREADGEWIPGFMYMHLNYLPIMISVLDEATNIVNRVPGFPALWEGNYLRYHYIDQARHAWKHCMELSRRGSGKSYSLSGIMAHNLILGENQIARTRVATVLTAFTKEYLSQKDGTFSKFVPMLDFLAQNTEFPRLMYIRRPSDMLWVMGSKTRNGNINGSRNSVMGLSMKDDEGKVRGKRGFILFEEMGNYPNFKEVWNNVRDSVKEGSMVFSLMYALGTAGDDASDFSGIATMLYHPDSFEIYSVPNVYDLEGDGTDYFSYFFPSYISRAGCMDKDGNSDVVKALREILMERWLVKQSGDAASLLSRTAQMPITPAEAILKVTSNFFPVVAIQERIKQLDQNPRSFDDVYVGQLVNVSGSIQFVPTDDVPIRDTGVPNTTRGALEIYEMPQKGTIPNHRYIAGLDPVDNDQAESESMFSCIVFDLFTDTIVAEYTGRQPFAEDNYAIALNLCLFYNATCLYESNKKGLFSYFAKNRALERLADCPDYLVQRGLVKYSLFGSSKKGVSVNAPINNFANELFRDWLMKSVDINEATENGEVKTTSVPNLGRIKNRALLKECVIYGPGKNTDRISAMAQVMLYREQFIIQYGGAKIGSNVNVKRVSEDEFFNNDWAKYKSRMTNRPDLASMLDR